MELHGISDYEFVSIRDWLFKQTGISLTPAKKTLVCSRLHKRLRALSLSSYGDYFSLLSSNRDQDEAQTAIDLLTTNETYFFREAEHFQLLGELAQKARRDQPFRVWSAACSSGEEVYTIAMTLAEHERRGAGPAWEVRGSDVSARVLDMARSAHYPMDRATDIPPALLKRYCLSGTGPYHDTLLVERSLREKIEFAQINLIEPLPELVPFDAIFLRNVLIYFDPPVKRKVVGQLLSRLTGDGVLFVSMAESLHGLFDKLVSVAPGAYRFDRRR
ncbi:CheR family methyltransferase [Rugamonas apoptosis]|uniref:Chemotaxis protein methyltransferase n=1 Tax=Rugamonas apoptosis TaxID=2758570 RepID=A0A7W2F8B1_9BURK|nr:CheR family methyltransferase [Rugamonas apoptosis]MBA5686983.1 SAM-dependent methyltransferase [Rugamonas apoptosis]